MTKFGKEKFAITLDKALRTAFNEYLPLRMKADFLRFTNQDFKAAEKAVEPYAWIGELDETFDILEEELALF